MPRELIDTGTDKRFVRRDKEGKFKESGRPEQGEERRRRQGRSLMIRRHVAMTFIVAALLAVFVFSYAINLTRL